MQRRDACKGLLALGATGALGSAMAATRAAYPPGFLWGVATAAHQIEGNNVNSDYWLLENLEPTNFAGRSGDACDSWHRWPEDVALVAALGLDCYRFSIEWARIEPSPGEYSRATLDQYRRLAAACRERGITPIATFHHFTSPRWLAAEGGWEAPATADRFARYCERSARAIGDLLGSACTMNEPNAQVTSYVMRGDRPRDDDPAIIAAAQRALGSNRFGSYFIGDSYRVRDVCLTAHARGGDAIRAVVPGLPVGMTLALQALEPAPGGEALYRKLFAEGRQAFYEAARRDEFLGVQPYVRFRVGPTGYLPAPAGSIRDEDQREAWPGALEAVIREAAREARVPLVVTEHGINTLDDEVRARHLDESLLGLRQCLADGIDVRGYVHWTLVDNFEWRQGWGPKFGLYSLDRETFARSEKPSTAAFRRLIARERALTAS